MPDLSGGTGMWPSVSRAVSRGVSRGRCALRKS